MKIFISYRRDDSAGYAGRLFDYLTDHFGAKNVFMDIDTIEPGEDFRKVVTNAVGTCDVVLVMIGKQWLSMPDAQGHRRLDDPRDWVRVEIAAALANPRVRVVPVLVRDANMPGEYELPDDLKELSWRNAIELSDARFQYDAQKLIRVIERVLKESGGIPAGGQQKRRTARYWGIGLGVIVLGLIIWMVGYGITTMMASRTPIPGLILTSTNALISTVMPTNMPLSTLTPSPELTPEVTEHLIQLIDAYYTCINTAVRDHRDDYVKCWNLLSDQPGEFQANLTANKGGLDAFIKFWNDFKASYALYYCFDQGQHYVDAEYYLHYWNNLSKTAGGKNLIEYSFALGTDGWRIVGGKVLAGNISPYCEAEPRIDKLSLFP